MFTFVHTLISIQPNGTYSTNSVIVLKWLSGINVSAPEDGNLKIGLGT
jgi:hypothetical protein